jgi:hypothetical protein
MRGRVRGKKEEERVVDVMKLCRIGERRIQSSALTLSTLSLAMSSGDHVACSW